MSPKIHPSFWSDERVGQLTAEQRYALLWCLTNGQRNSVGYFVASRRQFAFDSSKPFETLEDLTSVFRTGIVADVQDGQLRIWLRHFIKHQFPGNSWASNARITKHLVSQIQELPEPFFSELIKEYPKLKESLFESNRTPRPNLSQGEPSSPSLSEELHRAEQSRTEQNRTEQKEGGVGEGRAEGPPAKPQSREVGIPSDAEVFEFGRTWPGEPASGAPLMPEEWVAVWLGKMNGRVVGWPQDWRRAIVAGWRCEFRGWLVGGQKKNGVWQLTQKIEALRREVARHPANETSAAWSGEPTMQEEDELALMRQTLTAVERELAGVKT
ncbi:MAG: hypothetical protein HW378_203 [Anaerolineales bacterium]|nr:hypothetical protein [Anaerolineales bacterium]